jgi:hypothetical protein
MKTRFICLANSFKLNGRCVAGIELQANTDTPQVSKGRPKWIRPICTTQHGEVPTKLVEALKLLDIIEIQDVAYSPDRHQTENASFKENSIRRIEKFDIKGLPALCDSTEPYLFGNKGAAVIDTDIDGLTYSLMLVSTTEFEVYQKTNSYGKVKHRLKFVYNAHTYDLVITDPVFLGDEKKNIEKISKKKEIFVTISLALPLNTWHHKLIAGIIW